MFQNLAAGASPSDVILEVKLYHVAGQQRCSRLIKQPVFFFPGTREQ